MVTVFGKENNYMKKISINRWVLLVIACISFWVSSNVNWGHNRPQHIVKADGKGYYAYLPAVFIYQDLNFGFFDSLEGGRYYQDPLYYEYRKLNNGKYYNKYYIGTSVLMSPFFLAAHSIALLSDIPPDGYANIYPILINIGGIFYLIIGLFFCGKLLRRFGIDDKLIAFVYLTFYFGTNWFYWVNFEPGASHIYSAAVITMFYFYFLRFTDTRSRKSLYISALLFGLVLLIRPANVLILLGLPFFYSTFYSFKDKIVELFSSYKNWLVFGLIVSAIFSVQLVVYTIQVGTPFVDSYSGEYFDFSNPQIFNYLFSYKKGLFLYTPILLFSLGGLVVLFKKNKYTFFSWMAFLAILIYIQSSWHCWWYGGGFGTRVMLEYFIFWMVPFGMLLQKLKGNYRIFTTVLICILVLYCQFEIYQYRYNMIYWDGISGKEYWDIFLKLPS